MCVNKELLTNQSNQNLIQRFNQGLGNYNRQAKSRHLPAFINKLLLEHIHSHVSMDFVYASFHTTMSELSCRERNGKIPKPKYLLTGP